MSKKILCVGGYMVDELHVSKQPYIPGTSNPVEIKRFAGGVMGNVSRQLGLLDVPVELITVIGKDADAVFLLETLRSCSVQHESVLSMENATGKFTAFIEPDGSLFAASSSDQTAQLITSEFLEQLNLDSDQIRMVLADANLSKSAIQWLIDFARSYQIPIILEPVSIPKIQQWYDLNMEGVFMITPNEAEWIAFMEPYDHIQDQQMELKRRGIQRAWVRKGSEGSDWIDPINCFKEKISPVLVYDSTGAGDAALAGWVAGWYWGWEESACKQAAQVMASAVLSVQGSVHPSLSKAILHDWMKS